MSQGRLRRLYPALFVGFLDGVINNLKQMRVTENFHGAWKIDHPDVKGRLGYKGHA
jgi:hypothetical protein